MTPEEFVTKWSKIQQKETAVSHSHFFDVCKLVDHPLPTDYDGTGNKFSFETQTAKPDGRKGFADVFFKDHFIWEYKGPHKDLDKAYRQLQLYREDLQNPPLLITSDIHTIIIHTNFNNYPIKKHTITFKEIMAGDGVEMLRWAFFDPDKFKPKQNQQELTKASADTFIAVADAMKKHQEVTGEEYSAEQLAHFMARLLFTLFAEDMGLLQEQIFTEMLAAQGQARTNLQRGMQNLFRQMRTGGMFSFYEIRHFDGTLFDDEFVPTIPDELAKALLHAAQQDWSAVDPSIFGTLFERVIDEGKRAQLGAHYTSVDDIMLIVDPVLMQPLRQRWDDVRRQANLLCKKEPAAAHTLLADFAAELAAVRVLDPACGSGNFLYVALRQLLDLQKRVIAYAERQTLPPIELTVSPQQLYGIEINIYAHELAQITAWIGYLQWRQANGFGEMDDPVLRPLYNIKNMDAILAYDADGNPTEPEWPPADVIIGNPPFLGGYKIRHELGDTTVNDLFNLYAGHVSQTADLVVYWFARAWEQVSNHQAKRVGLIATQGIRATTNRAVLTKIAAENGIFMAWADKAWVLDGAAVRVSIIGFDDGNEQVKALNGMRVERINADLTSSHDLTQAQPLAENKNLTFQGSMIGGSFQISEETARKWLALPNPSGCDNTDVVRPYMTGIDLLRRNGEEWIVDFGSEMSIEKAKEYEAPFAYLLTFVFPERQKNRRASRRERWWIHADSQPSMRDAVANLQRYIATVRVAKHRLFMWVDQSILCSNKLIVIPREDDYFFGLLHSRVHEAWSLATSSRHGVGNDPAYTPTTCFETYPFPWSPSEEPAEADDARVAAIAMWARELVEWRQAWLHPPRNGMNGGNGGIDTAYAKMLKKRTLTNLYNGLVYYRQNKQSGQPFNQAEFAKNTRNSVTRADIEELDDIHVGLDNAVLDAYGWPHTLTDEQILERLLALNLQRAAPKATQR